MNKEQSKVGKISCVLALIPLLGFIVVFLAIQADQQNQTLQNVFRYIAILTVLVAPVIGVILGVISLFQKGKKLNLPIIGTLLNTGWIIFLIWGYMTLMTLAHSI